MDDALQVRSLQTLVRQSECEAERNADTILAQQEQIDTMQVIQTLA